MPGPGPSGTRIDDGSLTSASHVFDFFDFFGSRKNAVPRRARSSDVTTEVGNIADPRQNHVFGGCGQQSCAEVIRAKPLTMNVLFVLC